MSQGTKLWRRGVVVITTTQFHLSKPQGGFAHVQILLVAC